MQIVIVKNRTDEILDSLINVWENSVKATHTFLSADEIEKIKLYVPEAIKNVQSLIVAENGGELLGFLGAENKKIEMLFVLNEHRGQGIGKQLVNFAINNYFINTVTVNEQNTHAIGFYKHLGFKTYKRTEFDEQGAPYPLLYMRLTPATD